MIYDCFTFFNELDILDLRLQLLHEKVDKFILVESTKTHSNLDKPLYFSINKDRYKKYSDKIIHVVVSEFPDVQNSWTIENYQRNQIFKYLDNCTPNDLILISDVDEIPNPDLLSSDRFGNDIYCLIQDQYFFFYNYRDLNHLYWIGGTKVFKYKIILENLIDERKVHYNDISFPFYLNKGITATKIRLYDGCRYIYNGGWHFSYLGGIEAIFKKVSAFAHQELNNTKFLDKKRIEECLSTGKDVFERSGHKFICVDVSMKTHPIALFPIKSDNKLINATSTIVNIPFYYKMYQLYKIKVKKFLKEII
jgi:beta-1,4-mannosyl-glycoprotein beta-1,4-N-acetylglucosaminyltransferase